MRDRGFTLIELLVVVVIVGILAAIAIPNFQVYRANGFNARVRNDLGAMVAAQEAAFLDRDAYAECSDAGCNDPVLPGFLFSPGVGGDCAIFDGGATFQCGITHDSGTRIYYYTSATSSFWDTPN